MELAFYAAALVAVYSTLRVISTSNPMHALLNLIISLIAVAMIFFCLGAAFAGALQVIVYAGAIVVLILFVVMMLNRHAEEPAERSRPVQRWGSLLLVLGLGAGSAAAVLHSRATAALSAHPLRGAATLEALGTTLFREHLLALEATGLLLLAAMVAAVSLVKKEL